MRADTCTAARLLARTLDLTGAGRLLVRHGTSPAVAGAARTLVREQAFARLARALAASAMPEHRALAAMLVEAVQAGDDAASVALVSTAGRRPDLRAEKIVSHRYRFVWICNPKAASRSLIAALREADPGARVIRKRTLDEVLAAHPEAGGYYRFAFLRHPWRRTYSFYMDKHRLALLDRNARRWFIEPWYGVRAGMGFGEFCRWLATPCGSDAFADRHWLSQGLQIRSADGRLPDFLGSYETLQTDWRRVTEQLRMPFVPLPRLNARAPDAPAPPPPDEETLSLVRRRYAGDFALGGYEGRPAHGHR